MRKSKGDVTSLGNVDRDSAVALAIEMYGDDAATVAAHCAIAARMEGRYADFQFWFDLFQRLVVAGHA